MSKDELEVADNPNERVSRPLNCPFNYFPLFNNHIFSSMSVLRVLPGPRCDAGVPLRPPEPVPALLRAEHTGGGGQ